MPSPTAIPDPSPNPACRTSPATEQCSTYPLSPPPVRTLRTTPHSRLRQCGVVATAAGRSHVDGGWPQTVWGASAASAGTVIAAPWAGVQRWRPQLHVGHRQHAAVVRAGTRRVSLARLRLVLRRRLGRRRLGHVVARRRRRRRRLQMQAVDALTRRVEGAAAVARRRTDAQRHHAGAAAAAVADVLHRRARAAWRIERPPAAVRLGHRRRQRAVVQPTGVEAGRATAGRRHGQPAAAVFIARRPGAATAAAELVTVVAGERRRLLARQAERGQRGARAILAPEQVHLLKVRGPLPLLLLLHAGGRRVQAQPTVLQALRPAHTRTHTHTHSQLTELRPPQQARINGAAAVSAGTHTHWDTHAHTHTQTHTHTHTHTRIGERPPPLPQHCTQLTDPTITSNLISGQPQHSERPLSRQRPPPPPLRIEWMLQAINNSLPLSPCQQHAMPFTCHTVNTSLSSCTVTPTNYANVCKTPDIKANKDNKDQIKAR